LNKFNINFFFHYLKTGSFEVLRFWAHEILQKIFNFLYNEKIGISWKMVDDFDRFECAESNLLRSSIAVIILLWRLLAVFAAA